MGKESTEGVSTRKWRRGGGGRIAPKRSVEAKADGSKSAEAGEGGAAEGGEVAYPALIHEEKK